MARQDQNIQSIYPLSPMQQGLLFHTLLAPNSGVYFHQILYTLTGSLKETVFQSAWQQAVDRHEALRSLFVWEGQEKPLQVVRRRVTLPWEHLDWRCLSVDEQSAKLAAFLQADRQRGLDLAQAPVMRLALIRMGETHYELIWTHHHLLMDGWSSFLILKDVMAIYRALGDGSECRLERLRPYQDYINWLQKHDQSKAESFWRAALKGFTAPTPLLGSKTDAGHSGPDFVAAERVFHSSSSLLDAMKLFAKRHHLTLSTLVHAAWAILLSRYSGEQDIALGSTVSGRSAELEGVESMVGLLINTLPVRARFSPQDSVLAWLKAFQSQLVELRQYEHSALVDVQGWSEVRRDHPLFESMLAFENYPVDASVWGQDGSMLISNMRVIGPTNFPLALTVVPRKELSTRVSYDSRRFDVAAISRMMGHFFTLLEGMISNPYQRISALTLLTGEERRQLLVEWNRTQADYPRDSSLHGLFEEQVERTPEAVAVVFQDSQLTYRQLNEKANRLAHHLQRLGVGADTLVGTFVERSLEMIVGLLGILKAGGAYVPLDPKYPTERLALILEDAQPLVLLTQESLRAQLPPHKVQVVCLDPISAEIAQDDVERSAKSKPHTSDLAYVLYTSGSTGAPKGVMGSHRATVNRFEWMWRKYPFSPNEICCQKTALTFVDSVWEIFGPLLRGVPNVIVPDEIFLVTDQFLALLTRHRVTRIVLVPSLLRALLYDAPDLGTRVPNLRLWSVSGEVLPPDLARRFHDAFPTATLLNIYGSTEVTADVTCYEVARTDDLDSVPIGRPISNVHTLILDDSMNPVPVLVEGQIYVGGDCLSLGYWQQPELTSQRFIHNPFRSDQTARLFATRDRGRFLPDGNIEFLGRLDHQVKIRGIRIELGEIESVLAGHPGVREAVVLAHEGVPGNTRLVAYLTTKEGVTQNISELRRLLQAKLPDYMVPSVFVELERFPLTPSGKVDRKALLPPEEKSISANDPYVGPRTPAEEAIAGIWSEVLGIKHIGINHNFFELGGHSLLATRVISYVRDVFDEDLPLRSLFDSPTVEGMAATLLRLSAKPAELDRRAEIMLKVARSSAGEVDEMLAAAQGRQEGR